MFNTVDLRWKTNVEAAKRVSKVMEFCNNPEFLTTLREDIITLDRVQKNLEN